MIRLLATRLLTTVLRRCANDDWTWGTAMLRELDAIEGDWSALRWALGSASVVLKQAAAGILAGVTLAAMTVAICMGGLARLIPLHAVAAQWLTAVVLPEAIFVGAAFMLWRRRKAPALGFTLSAMLFVAHVALWSQTARAQASPSPELERLGYFIGSWHAEGKMNASMFGPAGPLTNTTQNEWTLDKHYYISHHEEHNSAGTFKRLAVIGYDAARKIYTEYGFDPSGSVDRSDGTFANGVWTWTSEFVAGGKTIKSRGTVKPISPTSYDFTWEIAPNGSDWTVIQTGTATKTEVSPTGARSVNVELDNQSVQVLRIRLAPHQVIPPHDVTPRVVIYLTDEHFRFDQPGGGAIEETHKAGDVVWLPRQRHGGENLSDNPVEFIAVVPKSP
jgi:quercetin dioxygenase-like cupin family protein